MRLTPLDIHGHRFARRLNGIDGDEVEAFLRTVADDYESLLRENQRISEELRRVQARADELGGNEKLLQETLLTAQSMGEEVRHAAVRESEVLLREAEVQGEKILDEAHRRAARLAEDIREMKGLRIRMAASLRASIETHLTLVDALSEDVEAPPRRPATVDEYLGAASLESAEQAGQALGARTAPAKKAPVGPGQAAAGD